jgi:hypothetical protein
MLLVLPVQIFGNSQLRDVTHSSITYFLSIFFVREMLNVLLVFFSYHFDPM